MDNKTIAELHRNAESMGLSVMSRDLPRDICGLYDDRHKLILLADWLNQRQRRCTLCHELIHAKHHDPGCGSQYGLKRAPVSQGDRAGVDQSRGLWHGGADIRRQYVDDGRGIGRHHPSTVGLSAAVVRFRRVRAIKEAQRPHTATGNKKGSRPNTVGRTPRNQQSAFPFSPK